MIQLRTSLEVLALVGLLALPVLGDNLLLNPSFELPCPPNPGNSQIWEGYYRTYSWISDPQQGDRVWAPNPVADGSYAFEASNGATNTLTTQTFQTVAVTSGAMVRLQGKAQVGNPQGTGSNEIIFRIRDGGKTANPIVSQAVSAWTGDNWVDIDISGLASSNWVTVEIATTLKAGTFPAAAHADALSLTSGTACSGSHTTTDMSPLTLADNINVTALVYDTNPAAVTAVKLVNAQKNIVLDGTINSRSAGSLNVTFPTTGVKYGKFNLVTEQSNCPAQVLVDWFEILCTDATDLSACTINPASLKTPQATQELTITGPNIHKLATVSLYQPGTNVTLIGVSLNTSVPGELKATFDFTSPPTGTAELGFYTLRGTRDDHCLDPAEAAAKFELQAGGDNVVVNGDFETGAYSPWENGCDSSGGGTQVITSGWFWGAGPHTGTWALGKATNGVREATCITEQVMSTSKMPVGLDYSGVAFRFFAWVHDISGNPPSWIKGELIVDGQTVLTKTLASNNQSGGDRTDTWIEKRGTWSGHVADQVKIRFTLVADGWDGDHWGVCVVDDVQLLVPNLLSCNHYYMDADNDGDVDQADFAVFQNCFTGPGGGPIPKTSAYCDCFDQEGNGGKPDNDLDQGDLNIFEACASGPGVPAPTDTICVKP